MTVVRTGVQQRIKETNPLAEFVPCNNHTLNLLRVHAASASVSTVTFFRTVQRCFYFFAASTHRWDVLKSNCSDAVKRAVDARWSARKEAVSCLKKVFSRVWIHSKFGRSERNMRQEKKQACFLVPYKLFHSLVSFICGSPYSRKWLLRKILTAKKKKSGPYPVCFKDSEFG